MKTKKKTVENQKKINRKNKETRTTLEIKNESIQKNVKMSIGKLDWR